MSADDWGRTERRSWPLVLVELLLRGALPAPDLTEERLAFGEHPAQRVIVVRPRRQPEPKPLVYFVHGGSWRSGSPTRYRAVARGIARLGHPCALGGYRLVPDAIFPAQRDDVLDGLAAVLGQPWFAQATGGRVILAGQSAGAQLAALAAFDEDARAARRLGDLALAGALFVSGVLDLDVLCPGYRGCPLVAALMGGRDGWEQADPAHFAHSGPRIPVLCLHGSRDPLVPVAVPASFVVRANGSDDKHAVLLTDPDGHHADLTRLFFGRSVLSRPMQEWLADVSV